MNELVDMGNKTVYELRTESGRSINTTANHPYLVRLEGRGGNALNPKGVSVNNLPLNSEGLTLLNKSSSDENIVLISGGLILMNMMPENFSGGNSSILPKCLSKDKITLPLALASLDISSSSERKGAFFTSYPDSTNKSTTFLGTFSSEYSFSLLEDDISFLFNKLRSIIQSRENSIFSKPRKVISNDLFWCNSGSQQIEHLPDHNSSILESGLAMTDFAINDYMLVDFNSHDVNSDNAVFKAIAIDNAAENLSYGNLNISDDIIEINGVNAKWVWVENLSVGDYIAVPDYETGIVKWERINSITSLDKQHVYDLNIEGTNNFIANDIVAHNTGTDGNNPPTSNGIYPNISINTSGLVALYHFNNESAFGENATGGDGDRVYDFSVDVNTERAGQVHNNGTTKNGATINKTNYKLGGGAGEFDGCSGCAQNDFVNAGSSSNLDNLGPLTFSAWIKPNSAGEGDSGVIVAKVSTAALANGRMIFFIENGVPTNALRFFKNGTTNLDVVTSNDAVSIGEWQHVVVTWDGSVTAANVHIYKNGNELSYQTTNNGASLASDAAESLIIGNRGTGTDTFDGSIDEVSIWNRTLSSAEILNLYKRGALRLNLSARTCDDAVCAGEEFTNANLTNSTGASISNLTNNRFFQYKSFFETDNLSFSPELYNVTVHYSFVPPVGGDTCTCPSSGDWIINCADNCVISSNCNMPNNDIHTYGTGTLTIRAAIDARNVFNRCNLFCYAAKCFE